MSIATTCFLAPFSWNEEKVSNMDLEDRETEN